ncbi:hypothetical protein ES703_69813 [subsurface metagenome]
MNKPIKWTLIGLGIFVGVVIVGFFGSAIIMGIIEAEKDIKAVSKVEEEIIVSEEKEIIEELVEEEEIIGYRETEDWGKVPVMEWKIGEPIDYPNGLRLILNKLWIEKQMGYPFVVINVSLINTTDKVQNGYDFELPVRVYVWDSQDNKFLGSGGFTSEESIWAKIDNLSPGVNKKWPPGKELTGNIYFNVSGNIGGLMVELEYAEFIRPNVIYCYKLEDIKE